MDLNDPHRRSIATTLQYMEKTLWQLETALAGPGGPHILYALEDDLTPLQKERISSRLHAVRSFIAYLKGALALEVRVLPLSQMVRGIATALCVSLEETQPKHLQRYGHVAEEIQMVLEPALAGIMGQLQELQTIVEEK